jgi:hypothetical protein
MDCIWSSSKAGITIRYVAPCTFKNQSFIDSFLNKVISLLNRQDTSLKIWVLINEEQLSFPNGDVNYFTSLGFDKLSLIADDSIFNYYQSRTTASEEVNNGVNRFKSELQPIDINFGNKVDAEQTGIKIIYNKYHHFDGSDWADLEKLILYASRNPEIVKTTQTRDTIRYNANGWYVSLLTIDTFAINKIIGRENQIKQNIVDHEKFKSSENYWFLGLLGLLVIGIIAYIYRRHSV